ncbi:unnamed protein product [Rhizoctonia solani]|uniref:Uncharacterized protein n=1 Tax=Rhizoctonia solani TaxID=456999 RepID=A0A8H2XUC8_9AGAM|nr:unnamed protein product [Rhizoctonia solani]
MDNEDMAGANLSRRSATSGARTDNKDNKDPPSLPPGAAPGVVPRPSTPTAAGPRGAQRSTQTPSRSATIDPSTQLASAPKQPARTPAPPSVSTFPVSSAPPALSPPAPSAPSAPSAPTRRSPIEEWESVSRPGASIEELKAKVAELEATIKQKDQAIKKQDAEIKQHDAKIRNLKEPLAYFMNKTENLESEPYRQEVLSIRKHLQVDDLCEPWEINKKFGEIVRKVEDISRDMGEALGSLPPTAKPTTVDLLKLISTTPETQSMVAATPTVDLEAEDFIDFGCRALINKALFDSILGSSIFHPGLKPDENNSFCDMYHRIRKQESQVLSGRWRISTLKLYANSPYSPKEDALRLCQNVLYPFCGTVVDLASCGNLIQSMMPRFEELFELALKWNHLAKNSVVMLDFHPRYHPPGSVYDSQYTILEGRRPKPPSSKAILLTSKLGLWSSNAVGGGKEPEYTIQTKATMLAAEYFA